MLSIAAPGGAIPPKSTWPRGFETDFISGFPDSAWSPTLRNPFRKINIKAAGFWHDLGYFYGCRITVRDPTKHLMYLVPVENCSRDDVRRKAIDVDFFNDLRALGVGLFLANRMYFAVRLLGKSSYFWANPKAMKRFYDAW